MHNQHRHQHGSSITTHAGQVHGKWLTYFEHTARHPNPKPISRHIILPRFVDGLSLSNVVSREITHQLKHPESDPAGIAFFSQTLQHGNVPMHEPLRYLIGRSGWLGMRVVWDSLDPVSLLLGGFTSGDHELDRCSIELLIQLPGCHTVRQPIVPSARTWLGRAPALMSPSRGGQATQGSMATSTTTSEMVHIHWILEG